MFKSEQDIFNRLSSSYWWLAGNHLIVRKMIKKYSTGSSAANKILDVGCGTGVFLSHLNRLGDAFGIDYSYDALIYCKNSNIEKISQADATSLPFKDNTFNSAMLLDIVEHVDRDAEVLREAFRTVKTGGLAYLMAPAFKCLWGAHDVKFHHKRRYSKAMVLKLISDSGFRVRKFTYLHPHVFPLMFLSRYIDRKLKRNSEDRHDFVTLPRFFNNLLMWMMKIEALFLERINFYFGTTIFCVLEKT